MKDELPLKKNLADDSLIARYLLGAASADERTLIEQHYFTEPDFYDQLLAVEDDLIDAYVRRELSPEQNAQFENYFALSPQRRERLAFAGALQLHAARTPQRAASTPHATAAWMQSLYGFFGLNRPAMRFALASFLAFTLLAALWFILKDEDTQRSREVARVEESRPAQPTEAAPQASPSVEQPTAENRQNVPGATKQPSPPSVPAPSTRQHQSASQSKPSSSPVVATFALVPNLLRGDDELRNLIIPRNATQLRLQLAIETGGEYISFQAELRRLGGAQIFRRPVRKPQKSRAGHTINLTLPADIFADGDYMLTVTGTNANDEAEVVGDYPFTVIRK
jgi:hypothetical protein